MSAKGSLALQSGCSFSFSRQPVQEAVGATTHTLLPGKCFNFMSLIMIFSVSKSLSWIPFAITRRKNKKGVKQQQNFLSLAFWRRAIWLHLPFQCNLSSFPLQIVCSDPVPWVCPWFCIMNCPSSFSFLAGPYLNPLLSAPHSSMWLIPVYLNATISWRPRSHIWESSGFALNVRIRDGVILVESGKFLKAGIVCISSLHLSTYHTGK